VEIEEWEITNTIKEETTTETKEETEAEVITNKDTITTEEIIITIIIKVQVSKDNSSEMDKAETKEVTDHNK
jgi:ATP-dependent Clp protease adapter protein ClpS